MLKIYPVETNEDIEIARSVFGEYLASREFEESIFPEEVQAFRKQLADLPAEFAEPGGCLLLARYGERPVGCVGRNCFLIDLSTAIEVTGGAALEVTEGCARGDRGKSNPLQCRGLKAYRERMS